MPPSPRRVPPGNSFAEQISREGPLQKLRGSNGLSEKIPLPVPICQARERKPAQT